jgi:Acetyltransferases
MRDTALSLLRRDSVAYMDMIYPILRGESDIIQADEDGQVVFDRPSGLVFANLPDTDGSVQKLMAVRGARGYVIHSDALADRFERIVRKKRVMRVTQVVYEQKQPPHVARVCSVRRLTEEDEEELVKTLPYDDEEEMRMLTKTGQMYGAFIAGEFAGRIGLHPEGCMGLLAVNPAFRRRGVGEALEAHLIRELLSRGITPYGQVRRDNAASMALSKALGFTFSDGEMTILF